MMVWLQPEQIQYYTIKRMAVDVLRGECSVLLGAFMPALPSILCKVVIAPAGFAATTIHVKFTPLDSMLSIANATEAHLRIEVLKIIGPWLDKLEVHPTIGALI